jgi:hypothetical protein
MDINKKIDAYLQEGKPVDADFILEIYKHAKTTYSEAEFKDVLKDLKVLVKLLKKSGTDNTIVKIKKSRLK